MAIVGRFSLSGIAHTLWKLQYYGNGNEMVWSLEFYSKARVCTHDYHTNGFVTIRCITIATSIGMYSPSVLIEVLRMWWQF